MNETASGGTARGDRRSARYLARHQVMGLAAQFVFGKALTLVGQPSETSGGARIASSILLGAHVLVAVGLVVGAVMVLRAAAGQQRQLAHWGAAMIGLTFVTGVLAVITKSNWWSYGMGIGFIASLALYAALMVVGGNPVRQAGQPGA